MLATVTPENTSSCGCSKKQEDVTYMLIAVGGAVTPQGLPFQPATCLRLEATVSRQLHFKKQGLKHSEQN